MGKMLIDFLDNNHDALEIIIQLVAVVVAFAAAYTYWLQKNEERKTASLLILNQIDDSEKIIGQLKRPENQDNRVLYKFPDLISENYWEKYKVLLIRYLNNSEIESLDRYYANIILIQKGKDRVIGDLKENWRCRSDIYNTLLKEFIELKVQSRRNAQQRECYEKKIAEKEEIMQDYWSEDTIFRAGVGPDMIQEGLSCFQTVKGTSVYCKLERKSYRYGSKSLKHLPDLLKR